MTLPTNILCEFDLSQAENRIVAYIAPDQTMIQTFEAGIDVHKKTASLIFQCPISAITSEQRQTGKQGNHSLNYDMGYRSFGLHWMIPETRAKWIVEAYHRAYPGVRQYHGWVQDAIKKQNRTLTNLLGRKRRFLGRMGDSLYKEAYAWIPQSSVADIINERGILYIWEDDKLSKEITLLNQVHDAVVFETQFEDRHRLYSNLIQIRDSLETPLVWKARQFVIPAELKMGFRLGKKYTKTIKLTTFETFNAGITEIINDASKVN